MPSTPGLWADMNPAAKHVTKHRRECHANAGGCDCPGCLLLPSTHPVDSGQRHSRLTTPSSAASHPPTVPKALPADPPGRPGCFPVSQGLLIPFLSITTTRLEEGTSKKNTIWEERPLQCAAHTQLNSLLNRILENCPCFSRTCRHPAFCSHTAQGPAWYGPGMRAALRVPSAGLSLALERPAYLAHSQWPGEPTCQELVGKLFCCFHRKRGSPMNPILPRQPAQSYH